MRHLCPAPLRPLTTVLLGLVFLWHVAAPEPALGAPPCAGCYEWKPLRVGAGGWITGLDISADGATRVVRTDTYGAYVWEATGWKQLVSASSMPAEDVAAEKSAGVYEIRVAPGDANRLYMSYRGFVYRSDDRGNLWTRTSFPEVSMDANDAFRILGQKMAIDPVNPDVVYLGTPEDGLFETTDGGSTWQRVVAVSVGQPKDDGWPGITGIAFDPSSGTTLGRTSVIYASSYGHGVWRTADAGASWARTAGEPNSVKHAAVHMDGSYYATGDDGDPNKVWRFSGGGWQDITPLVENRDWHSVMLDPFDASRVVLAGAGGHTTQSHDRGASWSNIVWDVTRDATDIPWLAWTEESYMSNGDMRFDPVTPNKLWFAEGIGVWTTTLPANSDSIAWTSQSLGIEQLVANDIAAPPGGRPVLAAWDRPLFYVDDPDVFPTQHGPNRNHSINMGWAVDYASTDPSFLAAIVDWWGVEESCYSTDGGQTWTRFPTMPPWSDPGMGTLAVSTPDNIVWIPSNRKAPYYTKDRGQTWQPVNLPGVDLSELHWAYYLNRHIVAADRVDIGTFYVHSSQGLYRSTNGGASWTLVHSGEVAPWSGFNALLRAVPGHGGHLFFTSGHQNGANPSGPFVRSTDGGATWSTIPNVLEVYAFGFGKEASGGSYPTIFIAGWVGGVYGIWRSEDEGQSWLQIGDWPLGSLDQVKTVEGDMNGYGPVYIGFSGSGYAYGVSNDNTPPVGAIHSPVSGATFAVGEAITLTGSGTDLEDGFLPPDRLSWAVFLRRGADLQPVFGPVAGNGVVFAAPGPEDLLAATDSSLEVRLTVTDFGWARTTLTRELLPKKVDLTFETVPSGLSVSVNGLSLIGPQTVTSWEGWQLEASAPSWQVSGPDGFVFSSWSTGAGNPVRIPTPAVPATYTATYQPSIEEELDGYYTLDPCRLVDTRKETGPRGGPGLEAQTTRTFGLQGVCGVSGSARALALNVTVTRLASAGQLRLYPSDELLPHSSTINFGANQTRANNAIVRLGIDGGLSIFCSMAPPGTVHVIVDVVGYFE